MINNWKLKKQPTAGRNAAGALAVSADIRTIRSAGRPDVPRRRDSALDAGAQECTDLARNFMLGCTIYPYHENLLHCEADVRYLFARVQVVSVHDNIMHTAQVQDQWKDVKMTDPSSRTQRPVSIDCFFIIKIAI